MEKTVSKSRFKPKTLEYFRQIEETGKAVIITDHGRPVLKIIPYTPNPEAGLTILRNTVMKFENPTEPVGSEDWESLK